MVLQVLLRRQFNVRKVILPPALLSEFSKRAFLLCLDRAQTLALIHACLRCVLILTGTLLCSAYRDMVDAGAGLDRDEAGKIKNPRPLLRAVEVAGVRLGPPGAGTLIALSDRVPIRPPTFEEFARCVLMEGSSIPGPQAAAPPPGRGRGLGHLCSAAASSSSGRGRGSGQQVGASMGSTGVRRAGQGAQAPMLASMGRGRGSQR